MVFALNPQPLIDARVSPAKVTDWVFAKVTVIDENNKEIEVDKFLKPYQLYGAAKKNRHISKHVYPFAAYAKPNFKPFY